MSHLAQSLGIHRLSVSDRLELVQEIWDGIAAEVEQAQLTQNEIQEVERRLAVHQNNPELAVPWEQVRAEALARLGR